MVTGNRLLTIMRMGGMAYLNRNTARLGLHTSAELNLQDICSAVKVFFKIIQIKIDNLFPQVPQVSSLVTNSVNLW